MDKWDWHRLNGNVAIWSREKDSISDEEYQKFFKVISKEPSDAQTWIHFKAEVSICLFLSFSTITIHTLNYIIVLTTPVGRDRVQVYLVCSYRSQQPVR